MRAGFMQVLLVATAAMLGAGICAATTANLHEHQMLIAAGVCLAAAESAMVPLVVTRGSSQMNVSQAALVSTMLHLFVSAGLGMGISSWFRLGQPFMYWLLMFYWLTLISVSVAAVAAVKRAPQFSGEKSNG